MIVALNYADALYKETQKFCTKSAYCNGIDKVYEYGPEDIDAEFFENNKNILEKKRGSGYWLWKPYFIKKTLNEIEYGDYLFYVDSGSYFIRDVHLLIDCMESNGDDIISFELPFLEKQWTKKEILRYFNCEYVSEITDTCQRIAGFLIMKKTNRTIKIIERYLKSAQIDELITDTIDPAIQDESFIENRHDQSLFSIIAKLEGIPVYKDPTEYGMQPKLLFGAYPKAIFKEEEDRPGNYEQLLVLHRRKKVTTYVKIMAFIRSKFSWKLYRRILKVQNIIIRVVKGK